MSRTRKLCFTTFVLLSLVALTEILVRLYALVRPIDLGVERAEYRTRRELRLQNRWGWRTGAYPWLPFMDYPGASIPGATGYPTVNSLGFRGPEISWEKPSGTVRLVCLGASTTWTGYPVFLQADLEKAFADHGLRLEVLNAACEAYTSAESLVTFAIRCRPLRPDVVVVYHAVNDAFASLGSEFRPDYAHYRRRLPDAEPLLWDRMPFWLNYLAIYQGLRNRLERHAVQEWEVKAVIRRLPDPENDPFAGTATFEQNLRSIRAIAVDAGILVVVMTQPHCDAKSWRSLIAATRAMNAATRQLAAENPDVLLVDLERDMDASPIRFRDFCHWKDDVGRGEVAARLGAAILRRLSEGGGSGWSWDEIRLHASAGR